VTGNTQPGGNVPVAPVRSTPKWVPWVGLGLLAAVLVLLATVGPGRLLAMLTPSFKADQPATLTLLLTNDTWGYVYPCG